MSAERKNKSLSPGSVQIHGLGAADGLAYGPVVIMHAVSPEIQEEKLANDGQVAGEIERLARALDVTREQLNQLIQESKSKFGKEYSAILESHFLMLEDQEMMKATTKLIQKDLYKAEWAFSCVMDKFKNRFLKSPNEYLRERAVDVEDVKKRLLDNLVGRKRSVTLSEPSILVADTIRPSDMAHLERSKILGFVSEAGSKLSHFAIVARSLNIPAVVGIANITGIVSESDHVLIDGYHGLVTINPDKKESEKIVRRAQVAALSPAELSKLLVLPADTRDGQSIIISANVELPEEIDNAIQLGARGIGLYRTEYILFTKRELPDEEKQYLEYHEMAKRIHPHKITFRTFDVGGDKIPLDILSSKGYVHEENPFLGWRAIRIALECPEFFVPQVRAILRLSAEFNVEIMIPMIVSLDEWREAKKIIEQCKADLKKEGIAFNPKTPLGVMIETPAAAILADIIAPEVDFFSVGTNDLVQYTLAVDRGNPKVSGLYNCFHPAVLHLLKRIFDAAHKHDIHVAMCGEMASNPYAVFLLMGMGLQEFSSLPPTLPKIKQIIRNSSMKEARVFAESILKINHVVEIEKRVTEKTREILSAVSDRA